MFLFLLQRWPWHCGTLFTSAESYHLYETSCRAARTLPSASRGTQRVFWEWGGGRTLPPNCDVVQQLHQHNDITWKLYYQTSNVMH